jgi:hypothetical protein
MVLRSAANLDLHADQVPPLRPIYDPTIGTTIRNRDKLENARSEVSLSAKLKHSFHTPASPLEPTLDQLAQILCRSAHVQKDQSQFGILAGQDGKDRFLAN